MDPKAMDPHGAALLAYFEGDRDAELIVRRDDGAEVRLPVDLFFREPPAFSPIEKAALELCRGHVLDAGAGSGLHSLVLQAKGLPVTAVDISPEAAQVMTQRGVTDVHCADLFDYNEGPFDTILMMCHGIGIVETLAGLDRFFRRAHTLLRAGGQILLDSLDVRVTKDPKDLAYHAANRRAGRYLGEIRLQMKYRDKTGPCFGWLHVDAETLAQHALREGWTCAVILRQDGGDYLARLTRSVGGERSERTEGEDVW